METLKPEVVDDGTKRDRRGRRIAANERIDSLVREYQASGLTQAEFARRAGVKYPTFAGWVRRRRTNSRHGAVRPAAGFLQVHLPARSDPAELSVVLPDGVVVRGGEVEAVAALVRALRS